MGKTFDIVLFLKSIIAKLVKETLVEMTLNVQECTILFNTVQVWLSDEISTRIL